MGKYGMMGGRSACAKSRPQLATLATISLITQLHRPASVIVVPRDVVCFPHLLPEVTADIPQGDMFFPHANSSPSAKGKNFPANPTHASRGEGRKNPKEHLRLESPRSWDRGNRRRGQFTGGGGGGGIHHRNNPTPQSTTVLPADCHKTEPSPPLRQKWREMRARSHPPTHPPTKTGGYLIGSPRASGRVP